MANLLQSLNISPSPLESTIFAGEVTVRKGQKPEWIQVVAYVDDLLVFAKSEEAAMFVFDYLSKSLKVKKTGLIKTSKAGGGSLRFLGRTIERKPKQSRITVRLDSTYLDSTFEAFQIVRGTDTPPDLRPVLDEEKPEKNECLTAEAVTRYRAALGKLGWMTQTFLHLSIYYSLLATGMSDPLSSCPRQIGLDDPDFLALVHLLFFVGHWYVRAVDEARTRASIFVEMVV